MKIDVKKWIVHAVMGLSAVTCWADGALQVHASKDKSVYADATSQAQLGNAKTKARFSMHCTPGSSKYVKGTRGFALALEDSSNFKNFNFEDFEGPEAPAGEQLTIQTLPGKLYRMTQSGGFQDDTFVFGYAELLSTKHGVVERIVGDIEKGAKTIEVKVTDTRQPHLQWVARFDVNSSPMNFRKLMCK